VRAALDLGVPALVLHRAGGEVSALTVASLAESFVVHPAAELFPMIPDSDFDAFVEDIRVNGQMEPVVLDADGRLLDGRNREKACRRLGVQVTTRRYDGDNPLQFVISHNLRRRHLTDSQRAMIAAELATLAVGTNRFSVGPPDGGPITQAAVKSLMQVSDGSLYRARVIQRDGTPELRALAKEASVPLETAARVARTTPAEQDAYVAKVRAGASATKSAPPAPPINRGTGDQLSPPKFGGNRRKNLSVLDSLINGLGGLVIAADEIRELDNTVTNEEATRLTDDLSIAIKSLNRINKLLLERAK